MQLFLTDASHIEYGVSRPGIPFLCDAHMELVQDANEFLRHVAIIKGRTRSPATWKTYGEHLYEYFSFLEENELTWQLAASRHVAAWRDGMIARGCSQNTANQRVRFILTFYAWANTKGHTTSVSLRREEVRVARPGSFLSHVSTTGIKAVATELTLRTFKRAPAFLLLENAVSFLDSLRPRSLRLMGYLALLTGMRRDEVTALDFRVVPNPAGHDPDQQLPMVLNPDITPTKGSKERTVMLPYDLAAALWTYFCRDWPKRARQYERRHGRETTRFFLSMTGEELSARYLNNQFSRASQKTGIRCHPHMLRHTFGTYELHRMIGSVGQTKALFWVRDRMGHSSITTTENYIHASDLIGSAAIDSYQADVCEALRRGC